jgi:AraC-like DNA-binding protein
MKTEYQISLFDLIIFLGVIQGLFLTWFFLKNSRQKNKANLYQGLLILVLSLTIFEEWLNNTGYIVKVLALTDFSEPLNFTFAPLFFLYMRTYLYDNTQRKDWIHFVLPTFWLLYMVFFFIQPEEVKYNAFIKTKHPGWSYLETTAKISDDPLGVRAYVNQLTLFQFIIYIAASLRLLIRKSAQLSQPLLKITNKTLLMLRNTTIHFLIILAVFAGTKLYYGMESDIGGHLIAVYISFMFFSTSYQVMNKSDFFSYPHSFLDFPVKKYKKSSLGEAEKEAILSAILKEMDKNKFFTNNLASLSGLAKKVNRSPHHVSQVINEKLHMSFFEMIAKYRIEESKDIIRKEKNTKITIEELAERVGYNSKSSFNTAFKKLTGQTPSEFRKNL